jgi:hypothetical protein
MTQYREVSETIDVPRNVGEEGFLRTVRAILRMPRVQEITINSSGRVSYRRFIKDEEPEVNLDMDVEDLRPSYVLRNTTLVEMPLPVGMNAAVVLGTMFTAAVRDGLTPLAFVSAIDTVFWQWYWETTAVRYEPSGYVYGLPLLLDKDVSPSALMLCATFGRDASLIDTQRGYKVEMPVGIMAPPETKVDLF